jgi:osmotically-inducible protein OsmY
MFGNSGFGNNFGGIGGGQSNFVGRDPNDMAATFGQMSRAGTQFFNNMNRNMQRSNRRSSKQSTVQNPAQPARVEVKVAFNPPRLSAEQKTKDIRARLAKLLAANHMSQPTVNMEGDTVVLSGTAASENERDVISMLLAIEPGVRDVRNEMTIGQPVGAAAPATSPTPN